eukprot:9479044-Pyramimonas_sp.AAC.1
MGSKQRLPKDHATSPMHQSLEAPRGACETMYRGVCWAAELNPAASSRCRTPPRRPARLRRAAVQAQLR